VGATHLPPQRIEALAARMVLGVELRGTRSTTNTRSRPKDSTLCIGGEVGG